MIAAPHGWDRICGGLVEEGDMYWHHGLQLWFLVTPDFVGQRVVTFHAIARRR